MFNTLLDTFHKGGCIMWLIAFVSIIVWVKGISELYNIYCLQNARKIFFKSFESIITKEKNISCGEKKTDNLICRISQYKKISPELFNNLFREYLMNCIPAMDRSLQSIAAWISVAPLLGLLGTVSGMIKTFQVITLFGTANPSFTADGISIALLTTVAGLLVAAPGMLLLNMAKNRKIKFENQLYADGEILRNITGTIYNNPLSS
jgi:biopolymer transport protein ExbB